MARLYKLTNEAAESGIGHRVLKWRPGVTHETNGKGDICGPGWLHAYTSPLLASFLNPIHANFHAPRVWLASGIVEKDDKGLKVGCRKLMTIRELELIVPCSTQRIAFGILCARAVYPNSEFQVWADNWLEGKDRNLTAAAATARAVEAAGLEVAGWASAGWAATAARAEAAVGAEDWAATAARATAKAAAKAAGWAAEDWAAAAGAEAARARYLDLISIAAKAMEY